MIEEVKGDFGGGSSRQKLRARTVMLTRPQAQSVEMTTRLEQSGAKVIHCPMIEVVDPTSWAGLDDAIDMLESYDWIVFTSLNGVQFFFNRLAGRRSDGARVLAAKIICAIGPATAKAIEQNGQRAEVIAKDSRAEGALEAIIGHLGSEQKLKGARFLIPRARVGRQHLPVELTRRGAQVNTVEAYQTIRPAAAAEDITRLFRGGVVDAITFTSSSTVSNFAALLETTDLSNLLANTLVACIGPVTAATAARYGLNHVVQPETYTAAALVEALENALSDG